MHDEDMEEMEEEPDQLDDDGVDAGEMCVLWAPSVGVERPHSRPQDPSLTRGAWLVGAERLAGPLGAAWYGEERRGAARRGGVQLLS